MTDKTSLSPGARIVSSDGKKHATLPNATKLQEIPNGIKFLYGGLAGMGATVIVQPLDLLKNRMQLSGMGGAAKEYNSMMDALFKVVRKEGVLGIYNGLSAGLFRQATYTTTRLGVYTTIFDYASDRGSVPFWQKGLIGMFAGAIGAFAGTPADLALVRMTSDGRLPAHSRRNYRHVFDALGRIVREEGVTGLWRGCAPTISRAMILNAAQLATYSQSKEALIRSGYFKDNIFCHFTASMASGFAATVASLPVDITKTRIQNMKVVDGVPEFRSAIDCFTKTVRHEGVFSLWKGFMPYFLRIGPHTVLTFVFLEQLNDFYRKSFAK